MDKIETRSTSLSSAEAPDIVLRETERVRLLFRPLIVDNPKDRAASVKGKFIYQKKAANAQWEDAERIPLSKLKKDEGVQLTLKSAEMLKLHTEIADLYALHKGEGSVPVGSNTFIRANKDLSRLAGMSSEQLNGLLEAESKLGTDLASKLLAWAASASDGNALVRGILKLPPEAIDRLGAFLGLHKLRSAYDLWQEEIGNCDEEFWQQTLTENAHVLEKLFAWPVAVFKGKAYVGGKNVFNKDGNVVDFLLQNELTENVALLEIKTPCTQLLGKEYRSGTYNISSDLTGSVMQVLNYKQSLLQSFNSLSEATGDEFHAFNPECVVLIGHTDELGDDKANARALELFRAQLRDVIVLTFDEVAGKLKNLIDVLDPPGADDAIPF